MDAQTWSVQQIQKPWGRQVTDWRHTMEQKCATIHFGDVKIKTGRKGLTLRFSAVTQATPVQSKIQT
jgi:hypothetical protein